MTLFTADLENYLIKINSIYRADMKQLQIRIYPDGKVEARTSGIKGDECQGYVEIIEQLLNARTVESSYTEEFYQSEAHRTFDQDIEQRGEERYDRARIVNKR